MKALEVLAIPLLDISRRLTAGELTADAARAELTDLQSRLPDILKEMNVDPETAVVLEETMSAALVNGIAEGAELTGVIQ